MATTANNILLVSCAIVTVGVGYAIYSQIQCDRSRSKFIDNPENKSQKIPKVTVTIFFGTCTGTAKQFALLLQQHILFHIKSNHESSIDYSAIMVTVKDMDQFDDADIEGSKYVLFITSTWTDGYPPLKAQRLCAWLQDYATDFRVSKDHLKRLCYAVFGLGGKVYGKNFCKAAYDMHSHLHTLGATALLPPTCGDDASNLEEIFDIWKRETTVKLCGVLAKDSALLFNRRTPTNSNIGNTVNRNQILFDRVRMWDGDDGASEIGSSLSRRERRELKKAAQLQLSPEYKQKLYQHQRTAATIGSSVAELTISEESAAIISVNENKNDANECCKVQSYHKTGVTTGEAGCCQNNDSGDGRTNIDDEEADEWDEEDVVNNNFATYDQVEVMSYADENEIDDVEKEAVGTHSDSVTTNGLSYVGSCGAGDEADVDLEDLGISLSHAKIGSQISIETASVTAVKINHPTKTKRSSAGIQARPIEELPVAAPVLREMATKLQQKALRKEGYKLIGSHSAVKLCRWTKHQLRGRGGCYKHTFYGISSYQCMEATPSLACANKCVFCWRHHRNPVGTEWRWKMDDPAYIVEQGIALHRTMINEFKGAPGVVPERLAEAFTVRHCALSLVGEPIMYPRINEMVRELHDRRISSFLVTNAQFPDHIRDLGPVTQLYVSVDAATRDTLRAIDRPLFKDFWERFLACLSALRQKRQRTVYRMTLVKDWNMTAVDNYAELIEMGQPDLIEIKGVTFCGKSDASTLTMENVPWHDEVCKYAELIASRLRERAIGPVYSIATEHEHSCCVLLAREDKFLRDGRWHTWIDYDLFYTLVQRYYATDGVATFCSEDYACETPEWALYQSATHGFDPEERRRWKRVPTGAVVEMQYRPSDSGCG